jgi:hypothetical protein
MRIKNRKKTAQMFFIEFGIAVFLFAAALALYFNYISNINHESSENIQSLMESAKDISASLVSAGYVENWDTNSVRIIGLTNNDNRINETKLENFKNISYDASKFLLATPYEYYVFFKDRDGNPMKILNNTIEGIGKPGVNSTTIASQKDLKSIIKVERIVILNSDIVRMVIYVWSV